MNLKLYPYQKEGVKFLLNIPPEMQGKPHRLLADEQGLGKTIQVIAAMKCVKNVNALIVCPASIKYNWMRQMVKWGVCTEDEVYIVKTEKDVIPDKRFIIVNYDLAIITNIHKQLFAMKFKVGVFDECHRMQNFEAKRTKALLSMHIGLSQRCWAKWLLSGTPIRNRPIEFYALLRTLASHLIHPYTKRAAYGKRYCAGRVSKYGAVDVESGLKWDFRGSSNIEELRNRIKPFLLRRELQEVYSQIPPLLETVVYIDTNIYQHPEVILQKQDKTVARTEAFNPELEMPPATIRRIIGEAKVPEAIKFITEKLETIDKILIFTYHRSVLNQLTQGLDYGMRVIQGGVNAELKDQYIQEFIANPDIRLFVAQITAGGEGIDGLQEVCSHIVYVELDWSDGGMKQSKSRLHRLGQKNPVKVTYLISDTQFEQNMMASLENKNHVINQLIGRKPKPMALELHLERIAVALEGLLAHHTGGGSASETSEPTAKPAKSAKGKAEKPKAPTIDDVKKAAKKFVEELEGSKAQAKEVIKSFGVSALADLDESDYAAAIEKFLAGPVADEDDDI